AEHGHDLIAQAPRAQSPLDFLLGERLALEVLLEEILAALGRGLDQLLAVLLRLGLELVRHVHFLEADALRLLVPDDLLHLDQIVDAPEMLLGADRDLKEHGIALQPLLDLPIDAEEVRARAVHLVDERESRHLVFVRLPPYSFRLRLDAADRAEHGDRTVEHAQAPLDLDPEVDVPRGIDDVDPVLGTALVHPLPEAGGRRRRDRDAALLLLLHPVHDGGAVMRLAELVRYARIEKYALRRRRLAGIDVRHDADVPVALEGCLPCHGYASNPLVYQR